MNDIGGNSSISGVDVEYLLKAQESCTRTIIENVDKRNDDSLATYFRTFDFEISKLRDVTKERHELFEKIVSDSKSYVELKIKDLSDLFSKEVQMLDNLCVSLNKKVDVLANATTQLVEEIQL